MSKMSQLHAELTEQANELGFESIEEAEADGYTIDYTERRLVKYECCDMAKEREQAHLAYIAEKEDLLERADKVWKDPTYDQLIDLVNELVCFIKKGEV